MNADTVSLSSKEDPIAAKQAEKEEALAKATLEAAELSKREARNDNIRLAVLVIFIAFLYFNSRRWNSAMARIEQMETTIQQMDKMLSAFIASRQ